MITNPGLDDPQNKIFDKISELDIEFKKVFLETGQQLEKEDL